jgi:hypothetical protein
MTTKRPAEMLSLKVQPIIYTEQCTGGREGVDCKFDINTAAKRNTSELLQ